MSKSTPESAVLKSCLQYLTIMHIEAWRNNTGAFKAERVDGSSSFIRFGRPGSSDIIGLLPNGRFLAIECKAPGGRISTNQTEFRRDIERNHGVYLIVYGVDDLIKGLKELLKGIEV